MTPTARPRLTLPEAEAEHLAAAYGAASVIVEFGSGGSTVLAAELAGKQVFSVESDRRWYEQMSRYFEENPPRAEVHLHHVDLGPTGQWGRPEKLSLLHRWPSYARSVWGLAGADKADVVLVDGRFRVACLLTAAARITRPAVALVDDYLDRGYRRAIERVLAPTEMIGRMARFELTPRPADWESRMLGAVYSFRSG